MFFPLLWYTNTPKLNNNYKNDLDKILKINTGGDKVFLDPDKFILSQQTLAAKAIIKNPHNSIKSKEDSNRTY